MRVFFASTGEWVHFTPCPPSPRPPSSMLHGGYSLSARLGARLSSNIEEGGTGGNHNADIGTSTFFSFDDEDSLSAIKQ